MTGATGGGRGRRSTSTRSLTTSMSCATPSRRPRCGRSSRPTDTATARSTSRGRRSPRRRGLCVALVAEGVELREAGIDAPILVLSEQPPDPARTIVEHRPDADRVHPARTSTRSPRAERRPDLPVHLKIDTGMQRVGAHPHAVAALVASIEDARRRCGWPASTPTSPSPTSRDDRSPPTQLARVRRRAPHVPDGLAGPRRQLGRCAGPSRGAAFVRARGIAHVRHLAGPASTTSPPSCARRCR